MIAECGQLLCEEPVQFSGNGRMVAILDFYYNIIMHLNISKSIPESYILGHLTKGLWYTRPWPYWMSSRWELMIANFRWLLAC